MRKSVKWVLITLGSIAGLIVVGMGVLIYTTSNTAREVMEGAGPHANQLVAAIAKDWRAETLVERIVPEDRNENTLQEFENLFALAKRALGAPVEIGDSEFQSYFHSTTARHGKSLFATFASRVRFEKGQAVFVLELKRIDDDWLISGFRLNSPALMREAAGQKS